MSLTAVTVSLKDLKDGQQHCFISYPRISSDHLSPGTVQFSTLEKAFGPNSLGIIIVKDVPPEFAQLRHRLLSYSSYLGNLPELRLGICAIFCTK